MDNNIKQSINAQILAWDWYDDEIETDDNINKNLIVRAYGRNGNDESVCINILNYLPTFYILYDPDWKKPGGRIKYGMERIIEHMTEKFKIYKDSIYSYQIVKRSDFYGFTNGEQKYFIEIKFKNMSAFTHYKYKYFQYQQNIYDLSRRRIIFKTYEANIHPMIRLIHDTNVNSVGWIQLDKYKKIKGRDKISHCQLEYNCNWKDIIPLNDKPEMAKFRIMGYDIETYCSIPDDFPIATRDGDSIIQIGMTMNYLNNNFCYHKHILTLNNTAQFSDDVTVECFDTERNLLLRFRDLIITLDPDIITGWNIFGYDWKYINARCNKLNIEHKFNKISKIKSHNCKWIENSSLSSKALGDNTLYYYETPGRINIDLMKIVQRDYKLASYSLDNVTAHFIRKNVSNINLDLDSNNIIITSENINGIREGQFIRLEYNDGIGDYKFMDGKKFEIIELTKNTIKVSINENINKNVLINDIGELQNQFNNKSIKIYWCQSKDDMKVFELFKLQKGDEYDRAIIAKYCIQDCELCNKLMEILQVMINNIGMAIVCNVPVQDIFGRGQGHKIQSLVSKFCKRENYIIPDHKRKNNNNNNNNNNNKVELSAIERQTEAIVNNINTKRKHDIMADDDGDDEGYEGAIVFDPKSGVYQTPVPVWDFSSLYPSSMILRNLSHEMFINPDDYNKYRNLEDYIIHTIEYHNKDGTKKICKFAEHKYGIKGLIPRILIELLNARKKYRAEGEKATDKFIKSIYDGRQLAYKLTANSLYGQTGAKTSPIYKKEIAASTTATGREMLQFSKYFVENIFAKILELISEGKKKEYNEYMNNIYKYYPHKIITNDIELTVHSCKDIDIPEDRFKYNYIGFETVNKNDICEKYFNNDEQNFNKYISVIENCDGDDRVWKKIIKQDLYKNNMEFRTFIDNIGYRTKRGMISRFYRTMRELFRGYSTEPNVIYGDTDSVFFVTNIKNKKTGEILKDKIALEKSIIMGIWGSILITTLLPPPMSMAYEKVLYPFAIVTKKRYVGNLYEKNPNKYYQKSMGIVLKRRDNANIVKIVCGAIINEIINKKDNDGAINITKKLLMDIIKGDFDIDKFVITKTLNRDYTGEIKEDIYENNKLIYKKGTEGKFKWDILKDCKQSHVMLAQRMAERNPGNKPQTNDRIPYIYYEQDIYKKIKYQGERIEHIDYAKQHNLKPDYLHYITNQIMNPCIDFLKLILKKDNEDDFTYAEKRATDIFNEYIIRDTNRRKGIKPIMSYLDGMSNENIKKNNINNKINLNKLFDNIDTNKKQKNKKK